ncbi:chitooligosaccharidolytic beta-N-acetylglucosaminidase-like [Anastrepha obliqua]|uniref:chitooligosaccharidolytic beta-N-acetylglucosaminidase-like n=1 Tax=Anastrepha obliqua TaxID=95512 RepID=UPI0024097CDB|nr:chitooligosaccharidolytic beta-N-acetylglucosaminidase-like [Anastrepha obliqua]
MERYIVIIFAVVIAFLNFGLLAVGGEYNVAYGYECQQSRCLKVELTNKTIERAISLPVCRLLCGDGVGTVWPKPTGIIRTDNIILHVDINTITFVFPKLTKQQQLWEASKERFLLQLKSQAQEIGIFNAGGSNLSLVVEVISEIDELPRLSLDTDESYNLSISSTKEHGAIAKISANTYFGARHGLETLSQLIVFDDIRREYQLLAKVEIEDKPTYKWRGILLDTSRHFYSVKSIKRTLDALAMVKLNVFHWHITDSQSFPLEIKSHPELHRLGAYSPSKVYTHNQISEVVQYGLVRGIRVMPEFDAPAHVSEGWQHKGMVACENYQPWRSYCGEPPCGQLDPTVDELYSVLEDIYREIFQLFSPDVFHMGGDEVLSKCWNASDSIRDWMQLRGWDWNEDDFHRLWGYFQTKALERVDKVSNNSKPLVTLWTSSLTQDPYLDKYLDKSRYIIHIWTRGSSPDIKSILQRGYRVIISNNDALYFDCGGPSWVGDGNNWCSPYIGWQKVYANNLDKIAGDYKSQVLGGEAAIWSEQIDEFTLDYRLWPRASALAERLWSNPVDSWREAESRILYHRERLVANGIHAEALQPEWCLQNENACPVNKN